MDAYNSHISLTISLSLSQNGHIWEKKNQVVCIPGYTVHLWMVNPAYFDLNGHLSHFDIDERIDAEALIKHLCAVITHTSVDKRKLILTL